jgi:sodium-dependent dicarboxylate transporter 2/3/5
MDCFKLDEVIYSMLEKGRKNENVFLRRTRFTSLFPKGGCFLQTFGPKNIWIRRILTLVVPLLLLFARPLGMTVKQSVVAGTLVLVITWWSTGLVSKIPSSLFLLGTFAVFGSAPLRVVLSFPLSETFVLIVLSYLLSQGIENSGLTQRTLEPLLFRFVKTPADALLSIFLVMTATIYMIPQPLARLIVVASIYRSYLKKTTISPKAESVLLFSIFAFYVTVNMMLLDADIILNTAAVNFAQSDMTNRQWMAYMALPTLLFCAVLFGLILLVFRKELKGVTIEPRESSPIRKPLTGREKLVTAVVICTILLWAGEGLLGGSLPISINSTLVTLVATILLFVLGALKPADLRSIDITTLVFLTAAFSIGAVMKASGIAEIVFSRVAKLFPDQYSLTYVAVMVLVSMGMHLMLGSNTTTMSVVLPGLIMVSEGLLSSTAALLICYTSLAPHYILPFHSTSMMIGSSNGFFPASYVTKLGIVVMIILIPLILMLYLPWWSIQGAL